MSDIPVLSPAPLEAPVAPEEEPLVDVEGFTAHFLHNAVKLVLPDGEAKLMSYMDATPIFREYFVSKDDDGSKSKSTLWPTGVFATEESSTTLKIGMYFPEGKQNIQYRTHTPKLSVVPNIVIILTLRKTGQDFEISNSKYYATSLTISEIPTKLSAYDASINKVTWMPFTNVYDDYRMCFGSNAMPRVFKDRDLRELYWYYAFLWNSPFNDDLGIRALRNNTAYYGDYPKWYAYLASLAAANQPFPYSEIGI